MQDIDYGYDIRGWLKSVNNTEDALPGKLYAQKLDYYSNGNISGMTWKNVQLDANNAVIPTNKQAYSFTYDGLNRLDLATYSETNPSGQAVNDNFFDEDPTYDMNGNILTMARKGNTASLGSLPSMTKDLIDNLGYTYYPNSNKLEKRLKMA